MGALDKEMKMQHAQMNLRLADFNEQISTCNDKFVSSMEAFDQILERDFAQIKEAIMKYFVYQTSFLKNTEYDANNIIAVDAPRARLSSKTTTPRHTGSWTRLPSNLSRLQNTTPS